MRTAGQWLLVLSTTAMLLFVTRLYLREHALRVRWQSVQSEIKASREFEQRAVEKQIQYWRAEQRNTRAREKLLEMLSDSTSRENFVVREGAWIAAARLKSHQATTYRIGCYLPPGRHAIKSAVWTPNSQVVVSLGGLSPFFSADVRRLPQVHVLALLAESDVFEIQITLRILEAGAPTFQLVLLGNPNAVLYDRNFELPLGTTGMEPLEADSLPLLAYPSELKIISPQKPEFFEQGRPTTELEHLGVRGKAGYTTGIRLWIESEAPACASAIRVAEQIGEFTGNSIKSPFDQIFEPYAGTGRYQFRAGLFETAKPVNR